jgi:rare lipoprotein A
MKRERTPLLQDRQRFSALRPSALIRATAVRAALIATIFGCTANAIAGDHDKAVAPTSPSTATPKISPVGRLRQWFETGQASWYGLNFQGHKTATGEDFDMNALTCAHRTLPLGSWIRVTNLRNRKAVLVRVNDRGPMVDNRIVDLSYAAARAVGLRGIGKVKLERVNIADPAVAKVLLAQLPAPSFPQLFPAH